MEDSQDSSSRCSKTSSSSSPVFEPTYSTGFEELRPWGAGQKFRSAAYADVCVECWPSHVAWWAPVTYGAHACGITAFSC